MLKKIFILILFFVSILSLSAHAQDTYDGAVLTIPKVVVGQTMTTCKPPTNQHKYLQLISTNDPFLATQGSVSCEGRQGFETFSFSVGNAPTHDPFSDPTWAGRIKQFLGVDK